MEAAGRRVPARTVVWAAGVQASPHTWMWTPRPFYVAQLAAGARGPQLPHLRGRGRRAQHAQAVVVQQRDAALVEQEQKVLESIVLLSELRADELMRPRIRLMTFRPPVSVADLAGRLPPSGYLLLTEPEGDEGKSGCGCASFGGGPAPWSWMGRRR